MNVFLFSGNLGKDAEVKTTQNGKSICTFSVALKTGWGDNEKTVWINCKMWGKRAEGQLPNYLVKGQQVLVSGEFSLDEWEKDGVKHSRPCLTVEKLDLVGQKPTQKPAQQQMQESKPVEGFDDFSDDVPF